MKKNSAPALGPRESLGAAITHRFEMLLQDAVRRIEQPSRNREDDIHAVRTDIKQARAMLRLIRPLIGERVFDRENNRLKKTAQILAPMRDATVGQRTIRKLARKAGDERQRREILAIETHFAGMMESGHAVFQDQALRAAGEALETDLRHLRPLRLTGVEWRDVSPGLGAVYRACRRRMKRAFTRGDGEDFHRWRIRVKNLYYELQFLLPVWPKRLRSMISRLKKIAGENRR